MYTEGRGVLLALFFFFFKNKMRSEEIKELSRRNSGRVVQGQMVKSTGFAFCPLGLSVVQRGPSHLLIKLEAEGSLWDSWLTSWAQAQGTLSDF